MNDSRIVEEGINDLSMNEYEHLLQSLSKFPSIKWLNQYFDLLKRLLTDFAIERDDPRIGLSLRKEHGMPVNFGQRYVLEPLRNERLGIIVPADFAARATGDKIMFKFTTNRVVDALFIAVPFQEGRPLPVILYYACMEACEEILGKTKRSGYRKFHSALLYDFTMERAVRNEILDEVNIRSTLRE